MLVFIPLLTFVSFLLLYGNAGRALEWPRAFVRAAILWGVSAIVITELLSLASAVTQIGLAAAWLTLALGSSLWLAFYIRPRRRLRWPGIYLPSGAFNRWLTLCLVFLMAVTALVAWLAPPQTWDSLNYHLPRAAHWAQEKAVSHFATGIEIQNSYPPGAEVLILHTYVLSQGDRLVNFVQWLAMLGSAVGAFAVAGQLGAGREGRMLAAVFAATIPMGIVQASSTMNDFVVSFWCLCAASECMAWIIDQSENEALVYGSLAAGLAVNTKPTAFAFLAPLAALVLIQMLRNRPLAYSIQWTGAAVLIVSALNAGYIGRNIVLYGNPIGPAKTVEKHANRSYGWRPLLSNVIRNAALHMGTPKQSVNEQIYAVARQLHEWIGIDDNDPQTTLIGPYGPIGGFATHEDVVGNLVHSGIIVVSFTSLIFVKGRTGNLVVLYGVAAALTFVLFSWIFKWQVFGTRLHLPFFVLFAPLVGSLAGETMKATSVRLVSLLLMIAAIPWLISINSRPLFPLPNRPQSPSILVEPRERLYFANAISLLPVYQTITDQINQAGCSRVGIALRGAGAEYPLWVQLGAPRAALQIEWITAGPSADRYEKEHFEPCAVICQRCPQSWITARGLPEVYHYGEFRLFLADW